jgi:hypothetical protein
MSLKVLLTNRYTRFQPTRCWESPAEDEPTFCTLEYDGLAGNGGFTRAGSGCTMAGAGAAGTSVAFGGVTSFVWACTTADGGTTVVSIE